MIRTRVLLPTHIPRLGEQLCYLQTRTHWYILRILLRISRTNFSPPRRKLLLLQLQLGPHSFSLWYWVKTNRDQKKPRMTKIDANEVCLREFESKGDILINRCIPLSDFIYP